MVKTDRYCKALQRHSIGLQGCQDHNCSRSQLHGSRTKLASQLCFVQAELQAQLDVSLSQTMRHSLHSLLTNAGSAAVHIALCASSSVWAGGHILAPSGAAVGIARARHSHNVHQLNEAALHDEGEVVVQVGVWEAEGVDERIVVNLDVCG